ncbi:MAG: hypothetical protein ACRELZ_19225 [Candidatus Rokuibacteriota bacterium]
MRTTRTRALASLFTAAAVVAASGCAHYWERPGGVIADFERDSGACVEDAKQSPYGPASMQPIYRACMRDKGWKRVEVSVATTNQFRGPEEVEDFSRPPAPLSGKRYFQDR